MPQEPVSQESMPHDELTVKTVAGDMRGAWDGDIRVFRGVPYAAPPVGPLRFAPPQPMPAWSGIRDATVDGPIAPQGRSRLAHVMGDFERPQSEDCLTLTLWAPRTTEHERRPVLVWIHGGAFSSGAGSLPWYAGERFAAADGIVAVSINYRLGALGFLHLPGVSDGNLGLRDQVAALQWVRANIRAFGGDPENVTVVGQSAGAGSIAALLTMPPAGGLFRRAIMQSTPFGRTARRREEAERIGRRFLELCGLKDGERERLKTLPVAALLTAQGEIGRLEKKFADAAAPFGLTIDGTTIPGDIAPALDGGTGAQVDIMIGTTREEMMAFYCRDPEVLNAAPAAVSGVFEGFFKGEARAVEETIRRTRAARTGAAVLEALFTDRVFLAGTLRFAEARSRQGRPAYVYQFDWAPPGGLLACHCIEIPFVFDNLANWADAPMLKGADPAELAGLTQAMHRAWAAFARTGNPNHEALPEWPAYDVPDRQTMRFDRVIGPVKDLAGQSMRRA